MLKSKLFYGMAVGYIAALSMLFQYLYPSVSAAAVTTVLTVLGIALAAVSYFTIGKLRLMKRKS